MNTVIFTTLVCLSAIAGCAIIIWALWWCKDAIDYRHSVARSERHFELEMERWREEQAENANWRKDQVKALESQLHELRALVVKMQTGPQRAIRKEEVGR